MNADIASHEESGLTVVNAHLEFPRVTLVEPAASRYLHVAAEVDARPAFLPGSGRKRRLLASCKAACAELRAVEGVVDASVFDAVLRPPGRGDLVERRQDRTHTARFDLAVLVEARSDAALAQVQGHAAWRRMKREIDDCARYVHAITATNVRRIGPVDHSRPGVFLFNYFYADDLARNLAVWNYTAGWFQAETGLDNSTVLLPSDPGSSKYSIINHCRWDGLRDILPSLVFKRTFRRYVLENFAANDVAAMPILYRLA